MIIAVIIIIIIVVESSSDNHINTTNNNRRLRSAGQAGGVASGTRAPGVGFGPNPEPGEPHAEP